MIHCLPNELYRMLAEKHRSVKLTIHIIALLFIAMIAPLARSEEIEVYNTSVITLRSSIDTDRQQNVRIKESDRTNIIVESEWKVYYQDFTFVGGLRISHDNEKNFGLSQSNHDLYFSDWSRPAFFSDKTMIELRNFYVQYTPEMCWFNTDTCSIKFGKQQTVWGQADGLKVLDIVNPQSFEYFILDDYDSSRIPLWTLNYEFSLGDHEFQFLWIPDSTTHFIPEPDRAYGLRSPFFHPVFQPIGRPVVPAFEVPDMDGSQGDFGFRYATFQSGWDITFNVLDKLSDFPSPFVTLLINDEPQPQSYQEIISTLNRNTIIGGTLSNSFGDFVLRTELAYTFNRQVISTPTDPDKNGITQGDELAYVIGLDWYGLDETMISVQYNMTDLNRFEDMPSRGKHDELMTLIYRRQFMNNEVSFKYIHEHNLKIDDGLIRISVSYDYSESINLKVEYNNFYGSEVGIFGQYNNNDHATFALEYTF